MKLKWLWGRNGGGRQPAVGLLISALALAGFASPGCGDVEDPESIDDWDGQGQASESPVATTSAPLLGFGVAWFVGNESSWDAYNPGGLTQVVRTSTGVYRVDFFGMAATGGNAQVTALGSDNVKCKIASWVPTSGSTAERLNVRCHGPTGALADSRFYAFYSKNLSAFGFNNTFVAYLWADQPSAASYVPSTTFNFNQSGNTVRNRIVRSGTGNYRVFLPGVNHTHGGGTVQVTGHGTSSNYCRVLDWFFNSAEAAEEVIVHCYNGNGNGNKIDNTFSLLYTVGLTPDLRAGAYAWTDGTHSSTHPTWTYDAAIDGPACVLPQSSTPFNFRNSAGVYAINFPNQTKRAGLALALVTAQGDSSDYCKMGSVVQNFTGGLFPGAVAPVTCYNRSGTRTDEGYQVMIDYPGDDCVGGM